ncbi:MAG: hypothetical protein ACTHLW_04560 [Verrucomicrobiota bacterium]
MVFKNFPPQHGLTSTGYHGRRGTAAVLRIGVPAESRVRTIPQDNCQKINPRDAGNKEVRATSSLVPAGSKEVRANNILVGAKNKLVPVRNILVPAGNKEVRASNILVPFGNKHVRVTNILARAGNKDVRVTNILVGAGSKYVRATSKQDRLNNILAPDMNKPGRHSAVGLVSVVIRLVPSAALLVVFRRWQK